LAARLNQYRGKNPLVLAIPRGAVPMAQAVAHALKGELDVVLVRKLRAPHQPELAMGALDESGQVFMSRQANYFGADAAYLAQEKAAQLATIQQRRAQYQQLGPPISAAGRVVIVVDDGLATGATMMAALRSVRLAKPLKLICAVPVSPPDTVARVAELADEVVCLQAPDDFEAVGQFYRNFPQVSDAEVVDILKARRTQ
jgi:predicted phosphoribosyltransferase